MNREELKQLWFSLPHPTPKKEVHVINVTQLGANHFECKKIRDDSNGFCEFDSHTTTKINNMNKEKVEQHLENAKRFRKANYKPLMEYINWSEISQDYDLKTGDLDYSDYNKLEIILSNFVKNNK